MNLVQTPIATVNTPATTMWLSAFVQPAVLLNGQLTVLGANEAFCKLTGTNAADTEGKSIGDVWPQVPGFARLADFAGQADTADTCQFAVDAGTAQLLASARFVHLAFVAESAILLLFEPVTAQQPLANQLLLTQSLFEHTLDCVKLLDPEGRLLQMNECGMRQMEVADFELLRGKDWLSFWGDQRPLAEAAVATARNGGLGSFRGFCTSFGGKPFWWDVTIVPVFNAEGAVDQLLATSRDVTALIENEKELKRRQELSRSLYDGSPDCLKVMDLDGNVVSLNEAGRVLLELDDAAVMQGVCWINLWKGEYRQAALQAIDDAKAGLTGRFSAYCPTSKGSPRWWDVVVTPIRNEHGEVIQLVSACRDITARMDLQQQIKQNEERLRLALEVAQLGVWEHHPLTGDFWADNHLHDIYDAGAENSIAGETLLDAMHPDDRGWLLQAVAEANAKLVPRVTFEHRIVTSSGRTKWLRVVAKGIFSEGGELIRRIGVTQDITAQKEAQLLLQESERRYRAIFNEAPVSIWEEDFSKVYAGIAKLQAAGVTDIAAYFDEHPEALTAQLQAMIVKDVNAASVRMFEATDKTDLMRNFERIVLPETMGVLSRQMVAIANGDAHFESEVELQTMNGKRVWTILNIQFPQNRNYSTVLVSLTDITERKKLEEAVQEHVRAQEAAAEMLEHKVAARTRALQEANTALERSNKELEEFAYVASHDLQEPLRKIRTFADRLQHSDSDGLSENQLLFIEKINHSAHRMTQLIRNLLDFSCLQAEPETAPVDLNELVPLVADDFDLLVSQKGASVHIGNLPVVAALPRQLTQVFQNLMANALKFSRPGVAPEVWIEAAPLPDNEYELLPATHPGVRYCKITVRDNGIGFNPDYADRIFDVFQRLHARSAFEGTGIGLAICRKIVGHIGGAIRAEGSEGAGAAFHLLLPLWQ